MKFSIIVPVYNVYDYLRECFISIQKQSYDNFEVIAIDDGSSDNSYKIMEEFAKEDNRFKIYKQKNKGVSKTRNEAILKAKGDYLIFVDSDDTINEDLLKELNEEITKYKNIDLVKYQLIMNDNEKEIFEDNEIFNNLDGEEAFVKLIKNSLFVTPVTYAYRRKYWIENKFSFASGRVHEDFGLIPYVVVKAKKVSSISFVGYNYIIRENSIMTSNSVEKLKKKNIDMLYHFDNLIKIVSNDKDISDDIKKIFKSYIANAMISRSIVLKSNKELLKEYVSDLKKRKIYNYLLNDNFYRRVKKIIFKVWPNFYIKLFIR